MNRSTNQFASLRNKKTNAIGNRARGKAWDGLNLSDNPTAFEGIESGIQFGSAEFGGIAHFKRLGK